MLPLPSALSVITVRFNQGRILLLALLILGAWGPVAECGDPDDYLLISNEVDHHYCRDFSVLLGRLRCEWLILKGGRIPESARKGNLVIIGRWDSTHTGEVIADLLPDGLPGNASGHAIFEVANPWDENGTIDLCIGSGTSEVRKAAEEAVYSMIGDDDPGVWIRTSIPFVSRKAAREFVEGMQYLPEDEMPAEEMSMEVGAKAKARVSQSDAAEDVEYLFYLFSHGYCGYRHFSALGNFEEAKRRIMEDLGARDSWTHSDLFALVRNHLTFIRDCHLMVGGVQYGDHLGFWHDTGIEVSRGDVGYQFEMDGEERNLVSVNGEDPGEFLFPSLNAEGDAVYRLGTLSLSPPGPLSLVTQSSNGEHEVEVDLELSEYHPRGIFEEESMGGVPVIRAHSFGDSYTDVLNDFLLSAERYRGEPYVIIDVRGNGGGNSGWPRKWVSSLTGVRPDFNMVWTEMITRTTMMGRINYFEHILRYSDGVDRDWYESQKAVLRARVDSFESGTRGPYWEPQNIPDADLIQNPTTIIVVMDGKVASAGEGLLSYLSGVQNVVLVGENSAGALTFGQNSYHRLPNSGALVILPISLNVFMDLKIREEEGFFPDIWVPARDALNYAVAAVRSGTISTAVDIPDGYFDPEFVPEKTSMWRVRLNRMLPFIALMFLGILATRIYRSVRKS